MTGTTVDSHKVTQAGRLHHHLDIVRWPSMTKSGIPLSRKKKKVSNGQAALPQLRRYPGVNRRRRPRCSHTVQPTKCTIPSKKTTTFGVAHTTSHRQNGVNKFGRQVNNGINSLSKPLRGSPVVRGTFMFQRTSK